MLPLLEGVSLQEAIRTTLAQLCKVGVVYQSAVAISGTIGVTIDKRQVILVHFDEHVECSQDGSESVGGGERTSHTALFSSPRCSEATPLSTSPSRSTNLRPNDPLVSQAATTKSSQKPAWYQFLSHSNDHKKENMESSSGSRFPLSSTERDMQESLQELPDTKHNRLSLPESGTTIELDSDDENFSSLGFDDDIEDTGGGNRKMDDSQVWTKKELIPSVYEEERVFQQNVIVIDDHHEEVMQTETNDDLQSRDSDQIHPCDTGKLNPSDEIKAPLTRLSSEAPLSSTPQKECSSLSGPFSALNSPAKLEMVEACSGWASMASTVSHHPDNRPHDISDLNELIELEHQARSNYSSQRSQRTCTLCGRLLLSQTQLEAHLVENHGITKSETHKHISYRECPQCGKKFRFQATLDKHLFLHVSQKPHKCETCGNAYCYAESLNIHMNSHSNNYSCQVCQKMYSSKQLFQKHIVYMHEMRRSSKK